MVADEHTNRLLRRWKVACNHQWILDNLSAFGCHPANAGVDEACRQTDDGQANAIERRWDQPCERDRNSNYQPSDAKASWRPGPANPDAAGGRCGPVHAACLDLRFHPRRIQPGTTTSWSLDTTGGCHTARSPAWPRRRMVICGWARCTADWRGSTACASSPITRVTRRNSTPLKSGNCSWTPKEHCDRAGRGDAGLTAERPFQFELEDTHTPTSWLERVVSSRTNEVVLGSHFGWLFRSEQTSGTNRWKILKPAGASYARSITKTAAE